MTETDLRRASRLAARAVLAAAGGTGLPRSERRQHQLLRLAATLDAEIIAALETRSAPRRAIH